MSTTNNASTHDASSDDAVANKGEAKVDEQQEMTMDELKNMFLKHHEKLWDDIVKGKVPPDRYKFGKAQYMKDMNNIWRIMTGARKTKLKLERKQKTKKPRTETEEKKHEE